MQREEPEVRTLREEYEEPEVRTLREEYKARLKQEYQALLKPWDLEQLKGSFRINVSSEPYPISPTMVDDLSQEDLDFLTNQFDVDPRFWGEVFHRINKSIARDDAAGCLDRMIDYLPSEVALAPMLLMVAEAYTVAKSPILKYEQRKYKSDPLQHANDMIDAVERFGESLESFEKLNSSTHKQHAYMEAVDLWLGRGILQRQLYLFMMIVEQTKDIISRNSEEIRAYRIEGIVPKNAHKQALGDRVYRAAAGCERLFTERKSKRGSTKTTLGVLDIWGVTITESAFRKWKMRQAKAK